MASAVFEKIKSTSTLPAPTGTALRILELVNSPETTLDQITGVIETDASLSSRLLKLVNSPLAGLTRKTGSIGQAVALLGLETVKGVSLGFSLIAAHRQGECAGFDYEGFWAESAARATAARHAAGTTKRIAADEAFTCGLLCQLGRLAFATAYPKSYTVALEHVAAGDAPSLCEAEREMFQIDHNDLAAEMMADWQLPTSFCDAVRCQETPRDAASETHEAALTGILRFSASASVLLTRHRVRRAALTALTRDASGIGIGADVVAAAFDAISEEWRSTGAILAIPTRRVPALAELYPLAS